MQAMQGWVIERGPFRGNGFAPSDTRDVIAEFKVDSARLPHGAEIWRLRRDGECTLVALLDADGPRWGVVPGAGLPDALESGSPGSPEPATLARPAPPLAASGWPGGHPSPVASVSPWDHSNEPHAESPMGRRVVR
jgi:hypothetical protein